MRLSIYSIVRNEPGKPLIIRDVGGDANTTLTNDAETVVRRLHRDGLLSNGRRLLYYDSDGDPGEMLHQNGEFVDFAFPKQEEFA